MWDALVGCFELAIYLVSSAAGGSLGAGVFIVSMASRLAILPFSYRLAKRARARNAVILGMKDDLDALKKKWANDHPRLAREMAALYRSRGLSMVDGGAVKGGLLQMPLVIALFHAVRRVSAGSVLSAGSAPIALLAGATATAGVLTGLQGTSSGQTALFVVLAAGSTVALTLAMGSGFGLYSAAFQTVSTAQGLLVRRAERRALAAGPA